MTETQDAVKDSAQVHGGVISSPLEFDTELARAKLDGIPYLEVTQEMFDRICRLQKTPYLMREGVRIYVQGTREDQEDLDAMSPEQRLLSLRDRK